LTSREFIRLAKSTSWTSLLVREGGLCLTSREFIRLANMEVHSQLSTPLLHFDLMNPWPNRRNYSQMPIAIIQ
jgi:hypothetical protein